MSSTSKSDKSKPKPLPPIPPYGEYAIEVVNLTFGYSTTNVLGLSEKDETQILNNLDLKLPTGSRCLLIGANGELMEVTRASIIYFLSHIF